MNPINGLFGDLVIITVGFGVGAICVGAYLTARYGDQLKRAADLINFWRRRAVELQAEVDFLTGEDRVRRGYKPRDPDWWRKEGRDDD